MPCTPVSDGLPGVPSVSSSLPSGVNLRTVWSRSSTRYTMSSRSMKMPCGRRNASSPHEARNSPVAAEDHDGMFATVEDENAVVRIDGDARHLAEVPGGRQRRPVSQGAVAKGGVADEAVPRSGYVAHGTGTLTSRTTRRISVEGSERTPDGRVANRWRARRGGPPSSGRRAGGPSRAASRAGRRSRRGRSRPPGRPARLRPGRISWAAKRLPSV